MSDLGNLEVTPSLYSELEDRARVILRLVRTNGAETHSLVNEVCLRLLKASNASFKTRAELLGFASKTMRSVLVDLARRRMAAKRGGDRRHVPFNVAFEEPDPRFTPEAHLLDVHEKLNKLKRFDPRLAKVVELRYFLGCTWKEVASVLETDKNHVAKSWEFARAWLQSELSGPWDQ